MAIRFRTSALKKRGWMRGLFLLTSGCWATILMNMQFRLMAQHRLLERESASIERLFGIMVISYCSLHIEDCVFHQKN